MSENQVQLPNHETSHTDTVQENTQANQAGSTSQQSNPYQQTYYGTPQQPYGSCPYAHTQCPYSTQPYNNQHAPYGTPNNQNAAPYSGNPQPPYGQPPYQNQPYSQYPNHNQPPYAPYYYKPADNTKLFSILSYIGVLWLVGLIADRYNSKIKFHLNQGMILSIFEIGVLFLCGILKTISHGIFTQTFSGIVVSSPLGVTVSGLISLVAWCFILSYSIIGIIHAVQDKEEPLPLIGNLFTILK